MPILPIPPIPPLTPPAAPAPAAPASGAAFDHSLTGAVDHLTQVQNSASQLEANAAAGRGSVADAMIAATQASLTTQVTVALTNRAISAFTDVMNLQV